MMRVKSIRIQLSKYLTKFLLKTYLFYFNYQLFQNAYIWFIILIIYFYFLFKILFIFLLYLFPKNIDNKIIFYTY